MPPTPPPTPDVLAPEPSTAHPAPAPGDPESTAPSTLNTPDQWLVAFLRDQDAACPACGYNLRGLTGNHCPECGQPLTLGVRAVDLRLGALITLLVCLTPAALIGLILAVALVNDPIGPRGFDPGLLLFMGYCLLSIPALVLLIACRRRFLRLAWNTQLACAAGPVLISLFLLTILFSEIL